MTCYSARYIGDKLVTYETEREYLLGKLVHKITRKLRKFYPDYPPYSKGYSIEANMEKIEWGSKGFVNHPLINYHFVPSDFKDLPYVFFDFKYVNEKFAYGAFLPFNRHYLKEYTLNPEEVCRAVMECAMIKTEPYIYVHPDTYIKGNPKIFKIIIPLSYYCYDERFVNRYSNGRHV